MLEDCEEYDEAMRKMGPQSFNRKGLYVLRPALYLYVSRDDWACTPLTYSNEAALALVESAHPLIAEEQ